MVVLCDIDDTLNFQPTDRRRAAELGQWQDYYAMDFLGDKPRRLVCQLVDSFMDGGVVYFITSRRQCVRNQTLAWLERNIGRMCECELKGGVRLIMRDDFDNTDEPTWKVNAIRAACPKATAGLVIEDNHETCQALTELGYTVMEVH